MSSTSLFVLNAVLAMMMFGIALSLTPEDFRRIARQPRRHAYFSVAGEGTIGFRTRDVEDALDLPTSHENFMKHVFSNSSWLVPAGDITPFSISFRAIKYERYPLKLLF